MWECFVGISIVWKCLVGMDATWKSFVGIEIIWKCFDGIDATWKYYVEIGAIYIISLLSMHIILAYRAKKDAVLTNAETIFDKFDNVVKKVGFVIWLLYMPLAVSLAVAQLIVLPNESFKNFVAGLSFRQVLADITGFELSVLAMLSICTALRNKYYAVADMKEVLEKNHVLAKCHIIIWFSVMAWMLYFFNLMVANLVKTEDRIFLTVVIQCDIAVTICVPVICVIHLLLLIFKLFLQDDKDMLLDLNYSIYDPYREKRPEFTMENKNSVDMVIEYLFSMIRRTDAAITNKFDQEKICGANFPQNYQQMPVDLHLQIALHAMGYMTFFSVAVAITANMGDQRIDKMLWSLLVCAVINVCVIIGSFVHKSQFQEELIAITLGEQGFQCKTKNGNIIYFGNYKRYYWGKHYGKHEQQYVAKMYNIVSLFRDALVEGPELAQYILKRLWDEIQEIQKGYLVYYICLRLYEKRYPDDAVYVNSKNYLDGKDYLDKMEKRDRTIVEHNVDVFVDDILNHYAAV